MNTELSPETLRIDMGEELHHRKPLKILEIDDVLDLLPFDIGPCTYGLTAICDQHGDINYYPGVGK